MFLKSLTLRGFKSFAERTDIDLEPGITVIVGPNGSGKSNIVDALAWVLGTRSAKLLRGGELADVIFAGSPSHPPLGRAKVEITIDNSAGQLGDAGVGAGGSAQRFSEVTISREIITTGESVYAINGQECRLLDIQELLSDTGLGRELHTIVGQGQLDDILHAKPEDRRSYVEEAAGILKHRRRRERAERKLEHVEVHLEKLRTVLRELRRQMRPLERQAEAANEHQRLQAELREVRIAIAAVDHARLAAALGRIDAGDADVSERQRDLESRVERVADEIDELEQAMRRDAPRIEAARSTSEALARLRERLNGTAGLIEERRRHLLETSEEPLAGRPPEDLRRQADRLDGERDELEERLEEARSDLEDAVAAREEAQEARREHDRRAARAARARAESRELRARWEGEHDARLAALRNAESEAARLAERLDELDRSIAETTGAVERVQAEIRELDAAERDLTEQLEAAEEAVGEAEEALEAAVDEERALEQARSSEEARAGALRAATEPDGGPEALTRAELDGVLGLLAEHVRVTGGAEAAVAAALGPLGDAVIARDRHAAGRAVAHLRSNASGRAIVLPVGPADVDGGRPAPGATPLTELIAPRDDGDAAAYHAVRTVLDRAYLVADWDAAVSLHREHPEVTFVTREGDLAGPRGYVGGSAPEASAVARVAAAEQAERRAAELEVEVREASAATETAREMLRARRGALGEATARINRSDARITGAAEELARLNKELDALERQREVVASQRDDQLAAADDHRRALEELEDGAPGRDERIGAVTSEDSGEVDRLDHELEAARSREMESRLAVERLESRRAHLTDASAELRREAEEVEAALADAARRRERRRRHVRRCGELAALCDSALEALDTAIADASERRTCLEGTRGEREERLDSLRERHRELSAELDEVREQRHATDLRRAEARHELSELATRVRETLGLSLEDVAEEHPDAAELDRDELVGTEDTLVRKLGLLGRINPLALEEFAALEQRHSFLSDQVDDLRASKRDLERVITAVDDKIREVFAEAFADVAREFTEVFATVFPGGEGRLVLTDPDDLLTTGIEVEARPPGKRIKRLSLLSGGERALTALSLLFAIFRARPSPFYVLDEVEAALDDVNLQRLLGVIESFKEASQLIVVTHQKRTMEIADVLYGVTMGADAVSKVVAERLSEPVSA